MSADIKKTRSWNLAKGYSFVKQFLLDEKNRRTNALLLLTAILSVGALVTCMFMCSTLMTSFWLAFEAKNVALFGITLLKMAGYIAGVLIAGAVHKFTVGELNIRFREWFTFTLFNKYTSGKTNHLDLSRRDDSTIDSPEQRIEGDVKNFVETSSDLFFDFLKNSITLIFFSISLWTLGGALSLMVLGVSITIPGFLFWIALSAGIIISVATKLLGRALPDLTQQKESLNAEFRKGIETLGNDGESIAQENGTAYFKNKITAKFQEVAANARKLLRIETGLVSFQQFIQFFASIFPYLAVAPLYFMGYMELATILQVTTAFVEVNFGLSWFADSYKQLAKYNASIERISALKDALDTTYSTNKNITRSESHDEHVRIEHLNIAYPTKKGFMIRELNVSFRPGEHTLIKGVSGLGKSTLFKILSGTWQHGDGTVKIPHLASRLILPQKPTIPHDTLKAVLAYPDASNTYTDEECRAALRDVGSLDHLLDELEHTDNWSKRLSGGQQQRISFVRALLKKPKWLFLDESTASLDTESEEHLYTLLKSKLPKTTLISIGHRPTIEKFHDRSITLKTTPNLLAHIHEHRFFTRGRTATNDEVTPIKRAHSAPHHS